MFIHIFILYCSSFFVVVIFIFIYVVDVTICLVEPFQDTGIAR